MSRVTYCSLEEAWGDNYIKKENPPPEKASKENVNTQIYKNKYDLLNEKSDELRNEVIDNMNNVERNAKNNNVKMDDFNKYRNNPDNIVKKNDYETPYTPYKESIEKKALQDKLLFLERQMKYYKDVITKGNNNENTEHFDNKDESSNFKTRSNDMIDLIILIIIGLLIIFVMDFVFKMGKQIGAKKG
jgi:hypothetical protein